MRIDDLLESVYGRLPEKWGVRIEIENDSIWIAAISPAGEICHVDSDEASVVDAVNDALSIAQRKHEFGY
jgi:hypothetical protein